MASLSNPFRSIRTNSALGKRYKSGVGSSILDNVRKSGVSEPTTPRQGVVTLDYAGDEQDEKDTGDGRSYFREIQNIRNTRGPALSEYQKSLKEQPTRETHKPSVKRRIGSGIAGALTGIQHGAGAGFAQAQQTNELPYLRAQDEYEGRMRNLGESARLEQDEVDNQIRALETARAMGLKYDQFKLEDLKTRHQMELGERDSDTRAFTAQTGRGNMEINEGNLDINRERANAYIADLKNKGYDLVNQADGSVIAVSKSDPNERITIPGETIQAANLGVARTNARTAQGQLGVSARNAATAGRNADTNAQSRLDRKAYQEGILNVRKQAEQRVRKADGSLPTPGEQSQAIDNALFVMKTNQRFAKYITSDDNGALVPTDNDGSPMYRAFMEELTRVAQNSMTRKSPFTGGDVPIEDDDDIIIGMPEN